MIKKYSDIDLIIKSENNKPYITKLTINIKKRVNELLSFFNITHINFSVQIMLWNNINSFRDFAKNKLKSNIPDWLCGWVENCENIKIIHTLTLDQLQQCKSHEKNNIKDLENLIIHEFIHVLIKNCVAGKKVKRWINEALATALSKQTHVYKFNKTLDNFYKDDFVDYGVFQLVGDYLINKEKPEYIIKLLKEPAFLESQIPKIFNNVNNYFNK